MEKIIRCNCCGKELSVNGGNAVCMEDYVEIHKTWGYFSQKDGMRQSMNICEGCFEAWVRSFRIPPQESEQTELL